MLVISEQSQFRWHLRNHDVAHVQIVMFQLNPLEVGDSSKHLHCYTADKIDLERVLLEILLQGPPRNPGGYKANKVFFGIRHTRRRRRKAD
ncbi:hypothetical protein R77592_04370 [Ralstonia mannitolilytica]|nr:hypothetical protein R77592_04370 [Ralstonia mannitolilytica]